MILANHLTESGRRVFSVNSRQLVYLAVYCFGLAAIFQIEDKRLFSLVLNLNRITCMQVFPKVLFSVLFLLCINNIVKDLKSNIRLFTDDTSLFLVVENPLSAAQILNSDFDKITKWAKDWLVSFNPIKTETMLLSRRLLQHAHPALYMLNQQITEVEHHKHLGIYFSKDQGMQSRDSCVQQEQAPALRYCLQEP